MLCIRGTSHGSVSVAVSVRLSVTSQSSTKTAKHRITQTTPHDSTGTHSHSAYANQSVLYYGLYTIVSHEGPQQGDPLGLLLFCNIIHPLLESLGSVLCLGHMDDVTLGGSQETVAKDV